MSLTVQSQQGTHTLGDGQQRHEPERRAIVLPGANSITGQTLHYDPSVAGGTIAADGGTTGNFLQRYYAAKLPACSDANYV